MAEASDPSQKTEAPSQRRLDEARERGEIPVSREVGTFLLFAVGAVLAAALEPESARRVTVLARTFLAQPLPLPTDGAGLARLLAGIVGELAAALAGPFLALAAAPIAGAVLQDAVVWTAAPLRPKLERLSPMAGVKRLLSVRALVELGKSLVKVGVVAAALGTLLWPVAPAIMAAGRLGAGPLLALVADLVARTLVVLAVVAGVVAAVDWLHQRFDFLRRMRMSRQEIRDEQKQSDGDPHVKQRLRALRLERTRRRMIADVPRSTVVIVNPTHFAVALRYVAGETAAPEVVAKGVDTLALTIRAIAAKNGVPIIDNPPLARALHAACEIGALIPAAYYQAVAEIISYVLRLADRR